MNFTYNKTAWLDGLTGRRAAARKLGVALADAADFEGLVTLSKSELSLLGGQSSKVRSEAMLELNRSGMVKVERRQVREANTYRLVMAASPVTTRYRDPRHVAGGPTKVYRWDADAGEFTTTNDPAGTAHATAA